LRFCGFATQKYSTTHNLQAAAELSVTKVKSLKASASETPQKQKLHSSTHECFWVARFGEFCFLSKLKNECFFVLCFGKCELRSI
jgi:hypothetical protein